MTTGLTQVITPGYSMDSPKWSRVFSPASPNQVVADGRMDGTDALFTTQEVECLPDPQAEPWSGAAKEQGAEVVYGEPAVSCGPRQVNHGVSDG